LWFNLEPLEAEIEEGVIVFSTETQELVESIANHDHIAIVSKDASGILRVEKVAGNWFTSEVDSIGMVQVYLFKLYSMKTAKNLSARDMQRIQEIQQASYGNLLRDARLKDGAVDLSNLDLVENNKANLLANQKIAEYLCGMPSGGLSLLDDVPGAYSFKKIILEELNSLFQ
jgi:protoporphyrinogen oxidase